MGFQGMQAKDLSLKATAPGPVALVFAPSIKLPETRSAPGPSLSTKSQSCLLYWLLFPQLSLCGALGMNQSAVTLQVGVGEGAGDPETLGCELAGSRWSRSP